MNSVQLFFNYVRDEKRFLRELSKGGTFEISRLEISAIRPALSSKVKEWRRSFTPQISLINVARRLKETSALTFYLPPPAPLCLLPGCRGRGTSPAWRRSTPPTRPAAEERRKPSSKWRCWRLWLGWNQLIWVGLFFLYFLCFFKMAPSEALKSGSVLQPASDLICLHLRKLSAGLDSWRRDFLLSL